VDTGPLLFSELVEEPEKESLLWSGPETGELESLWEQPASTPSCPGTARETVSRRRYSNSVSSIPQDERDRIKTIVARIVASFKSGWQPLPRIRLTGHADRDVIREQRQPGFELSISRERALAVQQEIVRLINNRAISSRPAFDRRGVGATTLVVQNAKNEREQEMNRRVEIELVASCRLLKPFVNTQEIFMHVYRPAPAAPAPFPAAPPVNAPLPALGPTLRDLYAYSFRNFNAAGQSDANRKAALRSKYDPMTLTQLRLAVRDNMLLTQRMADPSSPTLDCVKDCEREAVRRLNRPPTQTALRRIRGERHASAAVPSGIDVGRPTLEG
jgi:hypothetical protein